MLFRFSLYGFLKNQKYYEPFLILAFREKGLSFFMIGLLIGFRSICVNLFELPSGSVADLYGRRRCMVLSFTAYMISFVVFALASHVVWLFAAMLLFSVGEAFRTGTHKAMIFDWLKREGRENEKTRVYGYTRSWSQIGSAVSVLIAAAVVLVADSYGWIFWASCIPYLLGIINFLQYPHYLDGETKRQLSIVAVFKHLTDSVRTCLINVRLRRMLSESMLVLGGYQATKDYLQPVLKQTALALPIFLFLADDQRAAILVGAVYFVLYLLSAMSSRLADRLSRMGGGELGVSRRIVAAKSVLFLSLIPILVFDCHVLAIIVFVGLAVLQNAWRPIFLSRLDQTTSNDMGATVLSVDSQAKSLFILIAAPLLGLAVDYAGLWPVGLLGAAVTAWLWMVMPRVEGSLPATEHSS